MICINISITFLNMLIFTFTIEADDAFRLALSVIIDVLEHLAIFGLRALGNHCSCIAVGDRAWAREETALQINRPINHQRPIYILVRKSIHNPNDWLQSSLTYETYGSVQTLVAMQLVRNSMGNQESAISSFRVLSSLSMLFRASCKLQVALQLTSKRVLWKSMEP